MRRRQGTKRTGRRISVEPEVVEHRELRARHLHWIKVAAEGKARRGRCGPSYELVIAAEDWWFEAERDSVAVADFVERQVALPRDAPTSRLGVSADPEE
jgi:hypothetical protein